MTTANEPTSDPTGPANLTTEKLDRPDPAAREVLDFCREEISTPLNLDGIDLEALNLDAPSAEFEKQLIAMLEPRHRELAKAMFEAGRRVLARWRVERARRRRVRRG